MTLGLRVLSTLKERHLGYLQMRIFMWVSLKPLCLRNLRTESGFFGDLILMRALEALFASSVDNPHFSER